MNNEWQKDAVSDREWVERLIANDPVAWNAVAAGIILPMVKMRRFAEVLARINQPVESVLGVVYQDLQKNDFLKLRKFRLEGPLKAWLFFQVRNAVKIIVRESRSPFVNSLSDEELDKALDGWCTYDRSTGLQDEVDRGEACFARLWMESPRSAMVLLLKNKLGLSSDEVCMLLGLTSSNNVDQINRRAKQQMRQFKEGMCT